MQQTRALHIGLLLCVVLICINVSDAAKSKGGVSTRVVVAAVADWIWEALIWEACCKDLDQQKMEDCSLSFMESTVDLAMVMQRIYFIINSCFTLYSSSSPTHFQLSLPTLLLLTLTLPDSIYSYPDSLSYRFHQFSPLPSPLSPLYSPLSPLPSPFSLYFFFFHSPFHFPLFFDECVVIRMSQ